MGGKRKKIVQNSPSKCMILVNMERLKITDFMFEISLKMLLLLAVEVESEKIPLTYRKDDFYVNKVLA